MKTMQVTKEWYDAAQELASYIDSTDSEHDDFKEWIRKGKPPEKHILHTAAVIGGWEDSLFQIIEAESPHNS